ncbi:AAA family ATPase [Calycomorphotria hydatis]|uniref:Chromosome partition protein Smc n=1 Tax=Calycomorphotria hydatis TaxID=2528027 RepID=A0A517T420_9PLAN|nr:AAA family ATPase [Calycomorphotria hydatis]QDT63124.1 Chromosome partition protein Smc [Calycomorphotria hydatis]
MLQSLELQGFKSFADRTVFRFAEGLTAVVGPNGSGKSNVVDALKWILGDQSAKSLRGKEMADVIFNGSAGRKPANISEALLTFDNSAGFLPTEDRIVTVGRRLYRSGDSEYLLNGQVARLRDVRDLFLGTGTGSSAYAIIEQGRVDQILQANATQRRNVFEEAAGISRYKMRRLDAERKLGRVDQNLERLTDIVDEVEAQLNATRTQAAKAAKFREFSSELKIWWQGLAADEYRLNSAYLNRDRAKGQELESRVEALNTRLEQLQGEAAQLEQQLTAADEELRSAERGLATLETNIAECATAVSHQSTRVRELNDEIQLCRTQLIEVAEGVREAEQEHEHNTEVLANADAERNSRQAELQKHEADLFNMQQQQSKLLQQLEDFKTQRLHFQQQQSQAESLLAAKREEQQVAEGELEALTSQLEPLEATLHSQQTEVTKHQSVVEECARELQLAQVVLNDSVGTRKELRERREKLEREAATLRERRGAAEARAAVLEEMQEQGEGLGLGVREILLRARTINEAPWNRIYGTVADLIDVDLFDAPIAEVALGERSQLIVIESFAELAKYLHRKSSQIEGRVGFLSEEPLELLRSTGLAGARYIEARPVSPSPASMPQSSFTGVKGDLSNLPGVLRRADALIRPSERVPDLAERLLSDTWVVESLEIALNLAAGHGRGQRFVTQQGELLDSDGTLIVGTLKQGTAIVSRRSELIALRREIVGYETQLKKIERDNDTLIASLATTDQHVAAAQEKVQRAKDHLTEAQQRAAAAVEKADAAEREWNRAQRQQTELEEAITAIQRIIEETVNRQQQTAARLTELQLTFDQHNKLLEETKSLADQITEAQREGLLELAKREQRVESLREGVSRVTRDLKSQRQRKSDLEERLGSVLARKAELSLSILNTQARQTEAIVERETALAGISGEFCGREELRRQRKELSAREEQLRTERRQISDQLHKLEMKLRDREQKLETISERIRDEYQIELSELAQEDISAIQLLEDEALGITTDTDDETEEAVEVDATEADTDETATEVVAEDVIEDVAAEPVSEEIDEEPELTEEEQLQLFAEKFEEFREEAESRVARLRKKLKMLGSVNADSLADLDELQERYDRLSTQLQDLTEAKRALEDVIRRINKESKRLFEETFNTIRGHFQILFRKLFGGGDGDIVLEDPNDILDCGIDIVARPPGKELRSLSLLSGGEKTMTCVGLLLAIFKSKPSPFCILDEVDAALDEANIGRFVKVLQEFKQETQFIMITHRKPSMCEADVLYGVTMEEAGVSKRMSVRFDDIAEDGSFKANTRRAA